MQSDVYRLPGRGASVMTGTGKTEQLLHAIDHKLGTHKGARRVWLEGKRLVDAGFRQGLRYTVDQVDSGLVLRISTQGSRKVSGTTRRPVVDILNQQITQALGPADVVHVRFEPKAISIGLYPADRKAAARLRRLNARLQAGQTWRVGSCSHGAGVASTALLQGLGHAEMAFGLDISPEYIAQSLEHGPLARGGVSIVADLRDVDPDDLPECDVLEAGLPCVAASRAGRSKKHLEAQEDDPQVEDLEVAFLEVIRATQPAVVLLENVPEYADSEAAGRIRRWLGRWGYQVTERVLEGLEHSIENRRRWVMLATTHGLSVDLEALLPTPRPATLGEVLDSHTPASAWRRFDYLDRKEARDLAAGKGFRQQLLTPASTRVPTLRRGYQKVGSTDPRVAHPTRPGLSRLLTPAEHARIKGISPTLIQGLSDKVAHQVLGQSVISPAFVGLGQLLQDSTYAF